MSAPQSFILPSQPVETSNSELSHQHQCELYYKSLPAQQYLCETHLSDAIEYALHHILNEGIYHHAAQRYSTTQLYNYVADLLIAYNEGCIEREKENQLVNTLNTTNTNKINKTTPVKITHKVKSASAQPVSRYNSYANKQSTTSSPIPCKLPPRTTSIQSTIMNRSSSQKSLKPALLQPLSSLTPIQSQLSGDTSFDTTSSDNNIQFNNYTHRSDCHQADIQILMNVINADRSASVTPSTHRYIPPSPNRLLHTHDNHIHTSHNSNDDSVHVITENNFTDRSDRPDDFIVHIETSST